MRTKNKDVLMICKLWFITKDSCYDQESALCDYLKSRTMCPEIADESILHHLTNGGWGVYRQKYIAYDNERVCNG